MKKIMLSTVMVAFMASYLFAQLPNPSSNIFVKEKCHNTTRNLSMDGSPTIIKENAEELTNSTGGWSANQNFQESGKEVAPSDVTPVDNVGISDNAFENQFTVCNPVYSVITIGSASDIDLARVDVYDLQGGLQFAGTISESKIMIPADGFKSGIYFVRIYNKYYSFTKKIIKV